MQRCINLVDGEVQLGTHEFDLPVLGIREWAEFDSEEPTPSALLTHENIVVGITSYVHFYAAWSTQQGLARWILHVYQEVLHTDIYSADPLTHTG